MNEIATVPAGYTTVTPWVITHDTAALIDFLRRAFDATELARVEVADGTIGHAEVRVGDAVVMAFDGRPHYPVTPAYLRLYVPDAQAAFDAALAAGAEGVTRPTLLAWGDRVGRVRDPQGNVYWLQERVEEVEPEELGRRMAQPEFVAAMEYLQRLDLFPAQAT